MRTPGRTVVVEYKTRRRLPTQPASMWGNLDLQAVARQVEADGVLPDVRPPEADVRVDGKKSADAVASLPEAPAAVEDDRDTLAAPGLPAEVIEASLAMPEQAVVTVGANASRAPRQPTVSKESGPTHRPARKLAVAVRELTTVTQRSDDLGRGTKDDELDALETENRRLRRLMIVKLRRENDRLATMLRRFP